MRKTSLSYRYSSRQYFEDNLSEILSAGLSGGPGIRGAFQNDPTGIRGYGDRDMGRAWYLPHSEVITLLPDPMKLSLINLSIFTDF